MGCLVSKLSARNCLKQFLPKSTVKQISRRWFVFSFDKSKCQANWLFLSSFDKIVLVKEVSNILNAVTIRNRKETVNHALQVFKKRNLVDGSLIILALLTHSKVSASSVKQVSGDADNGKFEFVDQ